MKKSSGDQTLEEIIGEADVKELGPKARKVVINRDTGISLGSMPISRCSVSTRWRIEVSIMAAIARMLKSPLLVIDAADVLAAARTHKTLDDSPAVQQRIEDAIIAWLAPSAASAAPPTATP